MRHGLHARLEVPREAIIVGHFRVRLTRVQPQLRSQHMGFVLSFAGRSPAGTCFRIQSAAWSKSSDSQNSQLGSNQLPGLLGQARAPRGRGRGTERMDLVRNEATTPLSRVPTHPSPLLTASVDCTACGWNLIVAEQVALHDRHCWRPVRPPFSQRAAFCACGRLCIVMTERNAYQDECECLHSSQRLVCQKTCVWYTVYLLDMQGTQNCNNP
jgi:hypothetical protein